METKALFTVASGAERQGRNNGAVERDATLVLFKLNMHSVVIYWRDEKGRLHAAV
jgi:hypothetical protein